MYSGSLFVWLCLLMALGSFVLVPVSFLIFPILVFRLRNEEEKLRRDLPGYLEDCRRVPHRLIPFAW